jgi:hypothetical protein
MKKFYLAALFLLTLTFLAVVITGSFSWLSLMVFGLAALALVYSLALFSLYPNPRELTKLKY